MRLFRIRRPVRKKSARKKRGGPLPFLFVILGPVLALAITGLDAGLLPPVLAITEKTAKTRINKAIDAAVKKAFTDQNIESQDFLTTTTDNDGAVTAISVNTLLLNEICAALAADISDRLDTYGREPVHVPLAALLGAGVFANIGPTVGIDILPIGTAVADYETSFESVGINQVHFQLWLRVESAVRVANPLQSQDIIVNRKIALVNTVISGTVPDTYLGGALFSSPAAPPPAD